jgi:mannose-6-phosphate isomerase-like protein (cupin superfamily)
MDDINSIKHETAQERAVYNTPNNVFNWSWPKVPRHKFISEKNEAYDFNNKSLIIPLDISHILLTNYPATIPSILARYIRLKKNDPISHNLIASGEIYYVLEGKGKSVSSKYIVEWSKGDVFCLPGGDNTTHSSFSENSILFLVTNEPLLSFEELKPSKNNNKKIKCTHWTNKKNYINS